MKTSRMGNFNSRIFLLFFLTILFIGGCKSHNVPIPISGLSIKSDRPVKFRSITIYDRTDNDSNREYSSFGVLQAPIKEAPSFFRIISTDITAYFPRSEESQYRLNVWIHHAEPYRTLTTLQRIPGLRRLTPGTPTEYGVYLQILFEIEQNGKVVHTYDYYNTIRTMVPDDTGSEIDKGYEKLVATYRQEFFQQLDRDFIARHF